MDLIHRSSIHFDTDSNLSVEERFAEVSELVLELDWLHSLRLEHKLHYFVVAGICSPAQHNYYTELVAIDIDFECYCRPALAERLVVAAELSIENDEGIDQSKDSVHSAGSGTDSNSG